MTNLTKFQVRLPKELHKQLANAAEQNRRSMNAEVVARLADSFGASDLAARVEALEREVALLKRRK